MTVHPCILQTVHGHTVCLCGPRCQCIFTFRISVGIQNKMSTALGVWAAPALQLDNIGQQTLPKIWVIPFLVRSVQRRRKTEVILMAKMETRHPVGGPFGRDFSAFVIIAELWWPEVARPGNLVSNFCVFFFEKRSLSTVAASRIAPKICHPDQPPHLAHTVPDFIQIGSLSAELLPEFEPIINFR